MKEPVRRSSRTPRRRAESPKLPAGESRNVSSGRQSRRKRKSTVFDPEPEPKKSNIQSSSPAPLEVPKFVKKVVGGRRVDSFCWICHKVADDLVCNSCPRSYHKNCLIKKKITSFESDFCECKWMTVDGSIPHFVWPPPELAKLLKDAMQEAVKEERKNSRSQKAENVKIHKFFKPWPVIAENERLLKIVDIDVLIDRIHQIPPYQNTGEFFLDVKWIYHNCCILFNDDHEITDTALKLEKKIKQELLDIEACRDCYKNKHSEEPAYSNFFTKVCRQPHKIVWAKLRGSPFWPAKCLKIHNGHANVRFFGTHDKSNVSLSHIYRISRAHPEGKDINKMPAKLKGAMDELSVYISNYENAFGRPFEYYEKQTFVSKASPRSRSPRKRTRKGKQTVDHTENASVEGANCSGLGETPASGGLTASTAPATRVSGELLEGSTAFETPCSSTFEESDATNTYTGLFGQSSSTEMELSGSPELKKSKVFLKKIKAKIEASQHHDSKESFTRENRNNSECAEGVSNVPPVHCQLTFTTDEDADQSDTVMTESNPKKDIFSSLREALPSVKLKKEKFSASERCSKAEIFASSNRTSPACPEADLSEAIKMMESKKDVFTNNLNASGPFPVITSAQSTVEDNTVPIPASYESYPRSFTDCVDISSATNSKHFSLSEEIPPADDYESDDEIQVLKETHTNPLVGYLSKTAGLSKTLCDLLMASKPSLRHAFLMHQTASQEFFLKLWLEMQSSRLDGNDLKYFQVLYGKFFKVVESLKKKNAELLLEVETSGTKNTSQEAQIKTLTTENASLEAQIKTLTTENASQEAQIKRLLEKKQLREELREKIAESCKIKKRDDDMEKAKMMNRELEEKIKELSEKYNELEERFKEKEKSYKELEELYKRLEEKKEILDDKFKQLQESYTEVDRRNKELEGGWNKEFEERVNLAVEDRVAREKDFNSILVNEVSYYKKVVQDQVYSLSQYRKVKQLTGEKSCQVDQSSMPYNLIVVGPNVSAVEDTFSAFTSNIQDCVNPVVSELNASSTQPGFTDTNLQGDYVSFPNQPIQLVPLPMITPIPPITQSSTMHSIQASSSDLNASLISSVSSDSEASNFSSQMTSSNISQPVCGSSKLSSSSSKASSHSSKSANGGSSRKKNISKVKRSLEYPK